MNNRKPNFKETKMLSKCKIDREDFKTKTLSISENTYNNLKEVTSQFSLSEATIIRTAIYHGIFRLENGYIPIRDHTYKRKKRKAISLPPNTWDSIENHRKKLNETLKRDSHLKKLKLESIPIGELINILIDIELKPFVDYQKESQEYKSLNKTIYIKVDIPQHLYKKINTEVYHAGINHTQAFNYYLYKGLIDEYLSLNNHFTLNDFDVLNEIRYLNLDPNKVMTLLGYLIKSNRIKWVDNS